MDATSTKIANLTSRVKFLEDMVEDLLAHKNAMSEFYERSPKGTPTEDRVLLLLSRNKRLSFAQIKNRLRVSDTDLRDALKKLKADYKIVSETGARLWRGMPVSWFRLHK